MLLSIGYSACHWCHVMAHESFENEAIARLMNHHFVPVKVDREERPDVDEIYMAFVQATTGAGGWPLTAFLAPDRTPFFGGTYFPPEDRWGRPGFPRILEGVAAAWTDRARRAELLGNGARLLDRLRAAAELPGRRAAGGVLITGDPVRRAVSGLTAAWDRRDGGFGRAPKFPPARQAALLLRHYLDAGDGDALEPALHTLRRMADGGISDHLGGGFHRYATDREWLIPHFEKMLYDNALLVPVYLLAYRITGEAAFREAATSALAWMQREMSASGGGFHAALDADSEGREGAFYVWTAGEVASALAEAGLADAEPLVRAAYDVRPGGNWEGATILRRVQDDEGLAERFGRTPEAIRDTLARGREALWRVRERRPRPGLDDKVLLSWNALTISAFAKAHRALGDQGLLERAREAGRFVLDAMRADGRYSVVWDGARAKVPALLEDHGFWLSALLDLYESDHDETWLDAADEVADLLERHFAAPGGGFFTTADDHEPLPVRTRTGHDGALPSGNAEAADGLLRLAEITGRPERRSSARGVLAAFWDQAQEAPTGFSTLLAAGMRYLGETKQVVVLGRRRSPEARDALEALWQVPANRALVLFADPGTAVRSRVPAVRSAAQAPHPPPGGVTFLPCRGGSCGLPLDNLEAARSTLTS